MAHTIAEARLGAPEGTLGELAGFYGGALGLELEGSGPDGLVVRAGEALLRFAEARDGSAPFHHVALLVPGDRFAAAHAWAAARLALLPRPGEEGTVFAFPDWDAHALYVLDPAGTILELIAHRGLAERGTTGAFAGGEIAGLSEVGLVAEDRGALAGALEAQLGLELWDGSREGRGLGFVGRRGHTLILVGPGRGWLPTGRPAEAHPVTVTLGGASRPGARLAWPPHEVVADGS
jgi:hypothetical protein